jgi:hypothetical protein
VGVYKGFEWFLVKYLLSLSFNVDIYLYSVACFYAADEALLDPRRMTAHS